MSPRLPNWMINAVFVTLGMVAIFAAAYEQIFLLLTDLMLSLR